MNFIDKNQTDTHSSGRTKRDIIKNIAIVFLVIMLILTFFSNTIMNYSLPQVSTTYVNGGRLNDQIRGKVTIESAASKEIKIDQSRTIQSVEVGVGYEVKKGDVLLTLTDGDSAELIAAKDELIQLKLDYVDFLENNKNDYTLELLAISEEEEDIKKLEDELDAYLKGNSSNNITKADIIAIDDNIEKYTELKSVYDEYVSAITNKEYSKLPKEDYEKIKSAEDKIATSTDKQTSYETQIKDKEDKLNDVTYEQVKAKREAVSAADDAVYEARKKLTDALSDTSNPATNDDIAKLSQEISTAEKALKTATDELDTITSQYNNSIDDNKDIKNLNQHLNNAINSVNYNKDALQKTLDSIKSNYDKYIKAYEEKIAEQEDLKSNSSNAISLIEEIENKTRALNKTKIEFNQKQEISDNKSDIISYQSELKQDEIDKKQTLVNELEKTTTSGEIISEVTGVVEEISCVSGEDIDAGSIVMVISLAEKGFTAELNVTMEQATKVRVGNSATINNNWNNLSATIVRITSDKDNPSEKTLVFNVTGDAWNGQYIDLSVGDQGKSYEYLVPTNAIKEDNNGKYVLKIKEKSSPLGNRYYAERIDISVIASDDKNSAVSGNFTGGEYIISTASVPISSGEMVRIME